MLKILSIFTLLIVLTLSSVSGVASANFPQFRFAEDGTDILKLPYNQFAYYQLDNLVVFNEPGAFFSKKINPGDNVFYQAVIYHTHGQVPTDIQPVVPNTWQWVTIYVSDAVLPTGQIIGVRSILFQTATPFVTAPHFIRGKNVATTGVSASFFGRSTGQFLPPISNFTPTFLVNAHPAPVFANEIAITDPGHLTSINAFTRIAGTYRLNRMPGFSFEPRVVWGRDPLFPAGSYYTLKLPGVVMAPGFDVPFSFDLPPGIASGRWFAAVFFDDHVNAVCIVSNIVEFYAMGTVAPPPPVLPMPGVDEIFAFLPTEPIDFRSFAVNFWSAIATPISNFFNTLDDHFFSIFPFSWIRVVDTAISNNLTSPTKIIHPFELSIPVSFVRGATPVNVSLLSVEASRAWAGDFYETVRQISFFAFHLIGFFALFRMTQEFITRGLGIER